MHNQPGPDDRTQAELLDDLRYGALEEQHEALRRLAAVGEAEALDAVVDYLRDQPIGTGDEALDALRVLAAKYIPLDRYGLAEALIPFLSDDDWESRLSAVRLLNAYPNELATEAVRDLVEDTRDQILSEQRRRPSRRRMLIERTLGEAIMALANCGRLLVLPDILEMLDDTPLRVVATRALGVIGSETQRPLLEDLIEDGDPRVRDAGQWALGLMDERAEQFMTPHNEIPEPPPDRLHPIYWAHRQLEASPDDLVQFLVVRVALEHLLLDQHISEGRVPERCTITLRAYQGRTPPDPRANDADIVSVWEYRWEGPVLRRRVNLKRYPPADAPGSGERSKGASITISYPEDLSFEEDGLVSFDCHFEPLSSQGWIYRIARRDNEWIFVRQRRTWTS